MQVFPKAWLALALRRLVLALTLTLALCGLAAAQSARGVYAPGQAAVTGFSGAVRPSEIALGQDPEARMFIDLDGPSLRIVDLDHTGGPPQAQFVDALKPFTVRAKDIGQVFGVALDESSPANIYVAATSAYGLAIMAPGPGGAPQRVRSGVAGAAFMPGQWGPKGGPGSIWRIDGVTGAVTLFADVASGGKANSGAALGGLAYDPDSKSLFVADRETGLIHRFALNGAALGAYDHAIAGLAASGLPPAPAPATADIDIASPAFDSARPASWGYAPPPRRVFGLAVHQRRLYYGIAESLRLWSVGLAADGAFGADARIEVAPPPAAGPTEISSVTFDDQGRLYLAERPAPTGAQDFEALTEAAIGRVMRYQAIGVTATGQKIWQPLPDEYAIGLPDNFRNGNGGVALGYDYDGAGRLDPRSCGGFLWTTGEPLRNAGDPTLAETLGRKVGQAVNGLQGAPVWRIRRDDEPPRVSYFLDYADAGVDPQARGHLGAIAIRRACAQQPAQLTPGALPPVAAPQPIPARPPTARLCRRFVCAPDGGPCPVNQVWSVATASCASDCAPPDLLVNGKCCSPKDFAPGGACVSGCAPPDVMVNGKCCSPQDLAPGGACASGQPSTGTMQPMCGVTQTAIGPDKECCNNDHIYSGPNGAQLCCLTPLLNGKCSQPLIPKLPKLPCLDCCAAGYVELNGACCLKTQATSSGKCCPLGQTPSADGTSCQPPHWLPRQPMCCAAGYVPTAAGKCCAPGNLTSSGECCSAPVNPNDRKQCVSQEPKKKATPPPSCRAGELRNDKGACVRIPPPPPAVTTVRPRPCGANERRDRTGACVSRSPRPAPTSMPRPPIPEATVTPLPRPLVCPPGWSPGPMGLRCWPPRRGFDGARPPAPPPGIYRPLAPGSGVSRPPPPPR